MPDLLSAIVAATRRIVGDREAVRTRAELRRTASARSPAGTSFERALAQPDPVTLIAECKRRSPSRGVLRDRYDPARLAAAYEGAGAAAISVLTEPTFFDGSLDHLRQVRASVTVPVLRKDFLVTPYQVDEAAAAGADAVLLIVAALEGDALRDLHAYAGECGLAALVEVHDEPELERALRAGARIVGVNNRNLRTLSVDREASHRLIDRIPDEIVAVAESGIDTPAQLRVLRAAGYDAVLVGEALMTAPDPGARAREFLAARSGPTARAHTC